MKRVWWLVAVIGFMVMLYTCALPGDLAVGVKGEGLAGTYAVNGVDPTGLEYSGTLIIAPTDVSNRYELEWIVTGSILAGFGTLEGDLFMVEWESTAAAGPVNGTARYTLNDDGSLTGERFVDGFDGSGTEDVFPEP